MASAAGGGGGGPPPQEEDWRRKLVPEDRRRIVQKIINVLKDCATDASGSTDEPRLAALAARYEGTVYSTAPNNSEYFRQIANKLYTLQKKGQQVRASAAAAAAGGGGGVPQPPPQQPQPQQPPPQQQQRITQQQPQQLTALHQHHQQQRAAHHQQQQQAQQMVTNNGASMMGTGLAPANTAAMLQHQQQAMSSQQQVLNFKNQPQAQQQQPPQQLTPAQIASLQQQQQQQRGANPTVTTPAQRQAASQMMTGMPQQQTPQPHQPPLRATATAGQSNGIHHPHQPHHAPSHLVTPQQQTQQQRMATGAATPSAAAIHHGQIGGAGTMSKLKTTLANTVTPSGGQPTITSTAQPLSSSAMQTTSSSAPTNATTGSAETKPDPERLYWDKVRWMQQYLRPMMVMIRQIEKLKESIKVSPVTDPDKANKQRNLEGIHKKMTYIQRLVQHPSSGTDYVIQYQTLEAAERQIKHWLNQLQRDPSSSSSSTSAAAQQGPIGTGGPQPQATLSSGHGTVAATSGTVPTAPASTHFMPSGGTAYAPPLASNQQQPIKSAAAIPSAGGYHPQPSSHHPHPSHHPLHTKGSPSSAVPSATAPSPPSAASMGTTAPPAGTSTSPRLSTPHQYPHSTPPPVAPSALIGSSPPQLAPEPSGKHAGTPPLPHSTTGAASLVSTPPTAAPAATTTVKTEAPPASPQTPPQQQNVIQSFVERIRSLSPEAISRVANLFDETFSKVAAGSTMPGSSSHLSYLPDTPFNSLPGSHCSSSPDNPLGLATSHNEPPLKKTKLQGLKEAAPNGGVSSSSHSALFTMLSRPQTNALDESLWFGGLQHSPSPSRISKRKMTSA
ncbi:Mediator of RNA polymerase II transcription subunit 15 [Balamuthia mandrillaris]